MKKIIFVLLVFILCGCQNTSFDDARNKLDNIFKEDLSTIRFETNNHLPYFDYYIPSDLIELESGDDFILFAYDDSKIYMNLNITGIISDKYYKESKSSDDGFLANSKLVYSFNNDEFNYYVYDYDGIYLIHFYNDEVNMYASSDAFKLPYITKRMLVLNKGIQVKRNDVIAAYSNKDVIDYEKKPVDLFEYIIPSDGILEEILIDKEDIDTSE